MVYIERKSDTTILRIWQSLDLASHAALEGTLNSIDSQGSGRVIISLERCAYCDSAGLNVLLRAHARFGSRLMLVVPADNNSRRLFELCRLPSLMPVVNSMRDAFAAGAPRSNAQLRESHFVKRPNQSAMRCNRSTRWIGSPVRERS